MFPKESEVQIGGGAWQTLDDGTAELPVSASAVIIAVRNDGCCEAEQVTVPAGQSKQLNINLSFLPAQITPECDAEGEVTVQIDGKGARLGKPSVISFRGTLLQRDIDVVFTVGLDRVIRKSVAVHPKSIEKVTCAP